MIGSDTSRQSCPTNMHQHRKLLSVARTNTQTRHHIFSFFIGADLEANNYHIRTFILHQLLFSKEVDCHQSIIL